MSLSANYEELLGQINPFIIKRYLEKIGWIPYEMKRKDVSVFQYTEDEQLFQVMIPNDRSLSDYATALYWAVKAIADIEGKPVGQMVLTLLNPHTDIIYIRIDSLNTEPGTIPFDTAVDFYQSARELIAASVRDVLQWGDCHTDRPDDLIRKFISQCRIGQTEVGNRAIPLVCPFLRDDGSPYEPLDVFDAAEECAESLTRKVTRQIIEGIGSIKAAIDTGAKPNIPVSTNLCNAVAGICGLHADASVEFHAQWSPVVRKNILSFFSVKLSSDYIEPIKAISQKLKHLSSE